MKEIKHTKQVKKKPGQFLKTKKKHKNVQHNREQIQLLRSRQIDEAELFILDREGFKKVTVSLGIIYGNRVVYISNNGKNSKLKIDIFVSGYNGTKVRLFNGAYINDEDCIGTVIREEVLKDHNV